MTVRDVLEKLGYKVQASNNFWRMSALYRKSNSLSLSVDKETGWFNDFVTNQNGPLSYLVALTLNIGRNEGEKYLKDLNANFDVNWTVNQDEEDKVENEKKFDQNFLSDLLPSYAFYKNRGISEETLKLFRSGVKTYGKLNNRFVFPVFDDHGNLIGVSGRELFQKSERPKWKTIGEKLTFVFPAQITGEYIEKSSTCILVESIGDGLALYEAGVRNFLVLFGTKVSKAVILYLIRSNVKKVIVATNNDFESEKNAGKIAANKIRETLLKFFDSSAIEIRLPIKNDFGDMMKEEILEWAGQNPVKSA